MLHTMFGPMKTMTMGCGSCKIVGDGGFGSRKGGWNNAWVKSVLENFQKAKKKIENHFGFKV